MNLEAEQVSVRFGGVTALADVAIEIRPGEIFGLIGPNGAGKSTLINVLSGFQRPDYGSIRFDGRDITGQPAHRIARLGLSRTFQSVRLFNELTVYDNVASAYRGPRRDEADLVMEVIGQLDLSDKADLAAGSLPYGDERRVAIARAVVANPRFLMLDEPAAGFNTDEVRDLIATIRSIRDRVGCGVLLVEHNMSLIMEISERIQVLDGGRTLAVGTPSEIRHNADVRAAYLG